MGYPHDYGHLHVSSPKTPWVSFGLSLHDSTMAPKRTEAIGSPGLRFSTSDGIGFLCSNHLQIDGLDMFIYIYMYVKIC